MVKKFIGILVILFVISCSSDDEIESIYGTWKLTSYTLENQYDYNNDGIASNNVLSEIECFSDITFVLNTDNTIYYPETENGAMSLVRLIDSYQITCFPTSEAIYNWTLEGAEFRIVFSGNSGLLGTYSNSKITFIRPAYGLVSSANQVDVENEIVVYTKQ